MPTTSRQALVYACAVSLVIAAPGCARPRRALTDEALVARREAERSVTVDAMQRGLSGVVHRLSLEATAARSDPNAAEPVLDVLMLSGGADYGAFGAGFLEGWSTVEGPMGMPDFDIVTGVSTGALITPFVATGRHEDLATVSRLYSEPRPDWLRFDPTEALNPSAASLSDISGLRRDLQRSVNVTLLSAIASRADQGYLAVVSATNLDVGAVRVFDLGAEARRAVGTGTPSRVHDVLLASAAVPGMFPPVVLDENLYVDGGVTSNILSRSAAEVEDSLDQEWRAKGGSAPFPRTRIWIIVNNQLATPPKTVQPRWSGIAQRSISVLVRSHTRASLRELIVDVNTARDSGELIEVHYVAIPDKWRPPSEDLFDPSVMSELVRLGRRMGQDSASWRREPPEE